MGRLRTAVHNFSALDLSPDELLGHLDELVSRIDEEEGDGEGDSITGATCLYAIYDPVSGLCTMATAGHFAPGLVRPDGTVDFLDVPVFPPLGLHGLPFETAELRLPEGSRLVLYTDGLIEHRDRDIDTGLRLLRQTLADHADATPEETCQAVFSAMLPPHRRTTSRCWWPAPVCWTRHGSRTGTSLPTPRPSPPSAPRAAASWRRGGSGRSGSRPSSC